MKASSVVCFNTYLPRIQDAPMEHDTKKPTLPSRTCSTKALPQGRNQGYCGLFASCGINLPTAFPFNKPKSLEPLYDPFAYLPPRGCIHAQIGLNMCPQDGLFYRRMPLSIYLQKHFTVPPFHAFSAYCTLSREEANKSTTTTTSNLPTS